MTPTQNGWLSRSESAEFRELVEAYSVQKNCSSLGGLLWLVLKDEVGFTGKVILFACKTVINYIETWFYLLVLYGIFLRPYAARPHVDAATVAAFDLAPGLAGHDHGNDTLRYDLALNITFWNDHRIWDIRFNHFNARLYFNGTQISPPDDTFPKFKGKTRRHRTVRPALQGRASNVSTAVAEEFSRQRAQGTFAVEVRLRATLTFLIWPTWYDYYYEYECWLQFPSNATAMPAVVGGVTCSKGKRFALS